MSTLTHVCVFRDNSTKGNDQIKALRRNRLLLFLFVTPRCQTNIQQSSFSVYLWAMDL